MSFIGLVKFFNCKEYLDSLLAGYFHMTPPEKYRLDSRKGVGDCVESCMISYRSSRDDEYPLLILDGHVITGIDNLTMHNGSTKDSWLNCWFKLDAPIDPDETNELLLTLEAMKEEFGRDYAFVSKDNIPELIKRLNDFSQYPVYASPVSYDDDKRKWGTLCKSSAYAYQREYRFYSGSCNPHDLKDYGFQVDGGLKDIILDNPSLSMENNGNTIFTLNR
ncbi:MAG: hypothetical protein RR490_09085 [Niameybacter sp.]